MGAGKVVGNGSLCRCEYHWDIFCRCMDIFQKWQMASGRLGERFTRLPTHPSVPTHHLSSLSLSSVGVGIEINNGRVGRGREGKVGRGEWGSREVGEIPLSSSIPSPGILDL